MITDQARRFNDGSLEAAIAFGRATSLAAGFCVFVFLTGEWWWPAAVVAFYAPVVGWLSWWYFGNSSWKSKPIRVCGKHSPGGNLICNVEITEANMTHVGMHGDGLRDPEGANWWR